MRRAPALLGLLASLLLPVTPAIAADDPAAVVQAFNQAISSKNLEGALGLMAEGAVQFTLRPAHAGVTDSTKISGDLATHWRTIGPVLFGVTATYRRTPKIITARTDGDLATVWVQMSTATEERGGQRRQDSFSELYVLARVGDSWRIAAMADNRGTDAMAVGGPAAP